MPLNTLKKVPLKIIEHLWRTGSHEACSLQLLLVAADHYMESPRAPTSPSIGVEGLRLRVDFTGFGFGV